MNSLAIPVVVALLAAAADSAPQIVGAPDAPVRLDSVKLLNEGSQPLVLLYGATNTSGAAVEQFTVTVYVFDQEGNLKARQVAPGRRELKVGETKYSAMVLDVGAITAADTVMAGVDQVQRVDSEDWWRTDLRVIAQAAADARRPQAPPRRR